MNTTQLSQTLTQQTAQRMTRAPLTLMTGHVFQGKITKLFPNHIASLSLNGMHLTAKLEVPLVAGEKYWFEVKEGTGIPRLQVIDQAQVPSNGSSEASNQQVLKQLGLPSSKGMDALMQQLASSQMTLPKAALKEASQLLSKLNQFDQHTLRLVQTMIERQLPLTEQTAKALQAIEKQPSLQQSLTQLLQSTNEPSQNTQPNVKQLQTVLQEFLKNNQIAQPKSPVQSLITSLVDPNANSSSVEQARGVLVKLGVMNQGERVDSFINRVHQMITATAQQETIKQISPKYQPSALNQANPEKEVARFIDSISIPRREEGLSALLRVIQPTLSVSQLNTAWNSLITGPMSNQEKVAVQQVMQEIIPTTANESKGLFSTQLKQIISMLGYTHENDVMKHLQQTARAEIPYTDRLKATLMQLQHGLPEPLRERVSEVISRITGAQIIAQEQQGPLQQLLLQIPLSLAGFETDLTIQWEGRKQESGELDPNHCRVLFYLELESLNETIVDVQIQNRFISLTVFNAFEKPATMLSLLLPILKESLQKHEYQLSSFSWKKIEDSIQVHSRSSADDRYNRRVDYQGVDVRI
ncbi:hypothetical protein [Bacillus sp. FJAT-45037]|uniref:hypothetical protein n=1 Tax=Bacillus sp. FJAT-45037 TaxID=2011007 RepID=UPI000C23694C|nr:hypothetical protein [Bacillus sp. FJAT-45037]